LAQKRAANLREEAALWDILARDLKREAKRIEEDMPRRTFVRPPTAVVENKAEDDKEKLYVRISEPARMMGIGKSTLYVKINESRIRVRKAGRKTLIAIADIHEWFERLPEGVGDF